jgi:hypothetical protein
VRDAEDVEHEGPVGLGPQPGLVLLRGGGGAERMQHPVGGHPPPPSGAERGLHEGRIGGGHLDLQVLVRARDPSDVQVDRPATRHRPSRVEAREPGYGLPRRPGPPRRALFVEHHRVDGP